MNSMEALKRDIERALPRVEVQLRHPREEDGHWWLDATYDGHVVAVEWSPRRGFGICTDDSEAGYGEGSDEILENREVVANRVVEPLVQRARTGSSPEVASRELPRSPRS
jgi:hypothetical protein